MKNRFKADIVDEKFTLTFTHEHKQCIGAIKIGLNLVSFIENT